MLKHLHCMATFETTGEKYRWWDWLAGVSRLWLGKRASWIASFDISVTARTVVWADPFPVTGRGCVCGGGGGELLKHVC